MRRDLRRLADETFDLLIIGGGVYGAAMAWDATQRGLSVALIDRGDIGAGTSFNNAKTVHGGVRSLQHGMIRELREYLRERRALTRIAPHLVHPLPFLIPTYGALTLPASKSRLAAAAYFAAYDALTSDRNEGVDPARWLPPTRRLSRDECLARHPALTPDGVAGGILWHDCQMYSGDRVTLAYVKSAAAAGAAVANHVEATGLQQRDARVTGASVRDRVTGESFDVRAAVTVNATGPWAGELLASNVAIAKAVAPLVPALSLAMNVVVRPIARDCAVGGTAQGRLFFLAPWRDVTIGGTSHEPYTGTASKLRVTLADVTRLLDDLNVAFPGIALTPDDVRLAHRGLLPADSIRGSHVALLKHSRLRDHREDGWGGLMSMVGVRYTTARHTAQQATDLAFLLLNRTPPPCRTATTPLVGGDIDDYARFMRDATTNGSHEASATIDSPATAAARQPGNAGSNAANAAPSRGRLARLYGSEYPRVLALANEPCYTALAHPLGARCPVLGAEILFAVREEMAVHLTDALLRRTDAGSAGHPGDDAVRAAATIMGEALGWSDDRRRDEIDALDNTYRIDP